MSTPTENATGAIGQVQALLNARFTHDPFVPARVAMESAPGEGNRETQLSQLFNAIYHSVNEDIAHLNRELSHARDTGGEAGIRATISDLQHLQGSIQNHMQDIGRASGAGASADIAAKTVIRRHAGIMDDVRTYLGKRGAPLQAAHADTAAHKPRHPMSPVEQQWHNISRLSLETEHAAMRTAADIQDYSMALKLAQGDGDIDLKSVTSAVKKVAAHSGTPFEDAALASRSRRVFQAAKHLRVQPDESATVFMQLVGDNAEELLSRTQALATLQGNKLTRAMEVGFAPQHERTQFDGNGNITHVAPAMDDAAQMQQLLRQLGFVKHRIQHPEPGEMREHNIMPSEATKVVPLLNLVESLAKSASHVAPYRQHVNEEAPLADRALANVDAARTAFSDVMQGLHTHASRRCKECSSLRGKIARQFAPREADAEQGYKVLRQARPLPERETLMAAADALDAHAKELGVGATPASHSRFV